MPRRARNAGAESRARWDVRIQRAVDLAAEYRAASGILTFYGALAAYQRDLVDRTPVQADDLNTHFREALDTDPALSAIAGFLDWLAATGPTALAAAAHELQPASDVAWREVMRTYVADEAEPVDDTEHAMEFVVAALIQPFAERLARTRQDRTDSSSPEGAGAGAACRVCGGPPLVGVLREEGHGAKRALICAFCLSERDYRRVVCPSCDEQKFDALPVYTADEFSHVRIEACDTCRTYIKTIDLTKNGLAVPLVDDLASVTMDLWARERGYQRLRQNLLRV